MTDNFEKDINVPSKEITYPWVNIFKYGDDFTTGGIFYKSVKQASYEQLQKKCNELELKNRELKKCYKNNSALLDFEETNTTKLVNKVMKLAQTLTEIKEIAKSNVNNCDFSWDCKKCNFYCYSNEILQKISEVLGDKK